MRISYRLFQMRFDLKKEKKKRNKKENKRKKKKEEEWSNARDLLTRRNPRLS